MASGEERNNVASGRNRTVSDIEVRAAFAVNWLIPGPHRDKTIARLFGVSVRFAQYLRSGRCWTLERLAQAGRCLPGFDALLHAPTDEVLRSEMMAMRQRLEELETMLNRGGANEDAAALGGAAADTNSRSAVDGGGEDRTVAVAARTPKRDRAS